MGGDAVFTRPEAWLGGSYELAIEVGPTDDKRLRETLKALWAFADLDGCYLDLAREPGDQPRVDADESLPLETCLRGVAQINEVGEIACATVVVREDGGTDWIYFGLPMGSLGHVLPVGAFPFEDDGDLSWRAGIDDWLRKLAEQTFNKVAFRIGLVGWTDGMDGGAAELLRGGIPQEHWCGLLVPEANSLRWYPPNRGAPMTIGRR